MKVQFILIMIINGTIGGVANSDKDFHIASKHTAIYGQIDTIKVNVKSFGAKGDGFVDDTDAIQRAVLAAKGTYNMVVFPSGIYKISKAIKTAKPQTKFLFEDNAKLTLSNNVEGAFNILHNYCSLENAVIQGNGKSADDIYSGYGVLLSGVSNCKIQNNQFINISGCSIFLNRSRSKGCYNNKIIGNVIEKPAALEARFNGASGILLGFSGDGYSHENNLILNNRIDGNQQLSHGIAIIAHGKNNRIEKNEIKGCLRYGIVSYESDYGQYKLTHTAIIDNRIDLIGAKIGTRNNMGMGIYLMQSHFSVVDGNTITNVLLNSDDSKTLSRGAIGIGGAVHCSITNNYISNSARCGIYSSYGFGVNIVNNEIVNVAESGIYILNSSDNLIENNVFRNIAKYAIAGSFGDTGNFSYAKKNLIKEYSDVVTGKDIKIYSNVFYDTSSTLIRLTGDSGGIEKQAFNNDSGIQIVGNRFVNHVNLDKRMIILKNMPNLIKDNTFKNR